MMLMLPNPVLVSLFFPSDTSHFLIEGEILA
jgi:hypothetical protein